MQERHPPSKRQEPDDSGQLKEQLPLKEQLIDAFVVRPPAGDEGVPAKTRQDLDWSQVTDRLAHHCHCDLTADRARVIPFLHRSDLVERRLGETCEAYELVVRGDIPAIGGLRDHAESLAYAERGGVIEGAVLLDLAHAAELSEDLAAFFRSRREQVPLLTEQVGGLTALGGLAQSLRYAIADDGEVLDRASPELGHLRKRVRTITAKVRKRADQYLKDRDFEHLLQDRFWTLRDDRFVLPIRVEEQSHVAGILHGRSGSGQTVFIEPNELVELNNELSMAQLEVEREVYQVLSRLSGAVANSADALRVNQERMVYLDLTIAGGRLALEMKASRARLSETSAVELRQARHPLLALRHHETEGSFTAVPNDVAFGQGGSRVLLISGPNAGGKTVILKTVGLCALMTRSGLLIPVAEGSELPVFSEVFSDIGDEQSLADDLSSFSAHVSHMKRILPRVGDRTLLLLDELFSGTDPSQGASLGAALIEHLAAKGALIGASTHFEPLKRFALNSAIAVNASMGFDVANLNPTFTLQVGLPGSSNALRIAERMGFPPGLLVRAREFAEEEGASDVDQMIDILNLQGARLDKREADLRSAIQEANASERRYRSELGRLKKQALAGIDSEVAAVYDQIAEVGALVKRRRRQLASAANTVTEAELTQAQTELNAAKRRLVDQKKERARSEVRKDRAPLDEAAIEPGAPVWIGPLGRPATVIERVGRKQVMLRVGTMKVTFKVRDLYEHTPEEAASAPPATAKPEAVVAAPPAVRERSGDEVHVQSRENTLDLRGERVDDALERLDLYLDEAYAREEAGIWVIHGHGTGALKQAVRQFARSSDYVGRFRPGERGEGGDGVTLLVMR